MLKHKAESPHNDDELDFESTWLQQKKTKKSKRKVVLRKLDEIIQTDYATSGVVVYHQEKKIVLRLEKPTFHKQVVTLKKINPAEQEKEEHIQRQTNSPQVKDKLLQANSPQKQLSNSPQKLERGNINSRSQSRNISRPKSRNNNGGQSPKTADKVSTKTQFSFHPQESEQKPLQPLMTPEMLFDFQISQVKAFKGSSRQLQVQEEPEYVFPKHFYKNPEQTKYITEAELQIIKFIKKSIERKRTTQNFFMSKLKPPVEEIVITSINEKSLFFNSQFESGNLREVEKIRDLEYNLFLNFDHNTLNYSQWFFFSVHNIQKGHQYRFNIMNMQKDDSAFSYGMKPFVYSEKKNKANNTNEWQRGGFDIRYFRNNQKTTDRECAPDYDWDHEMIPCYEFDSEDAKKLPLHTLSFNYIFEYDHDTVFFAYFQPYTLSDLQDMLYMLKSKYPEEHLNQILKINNLCDSIAGNPCYLLTITSDVKRTDISLNNLGLNATAQLNQKKAGAERRLSKLPTNQQVNAPTGFIENQNDQEQKFTDGQTNKDEAANFIFREMPASGSKKQIIFLQSRVHPGESNAQFMIQGAIEFLLQQNDKEAQLLRDTFIFKIIPMINPDGVIIGNYRCNLAGADMNRRYPNPSRFIHPEIFYIKKLIAAYHRENQVVLFCDMHGHSRKRNVFMYGCVSGQSEINQHKNNNLIKVLPYFLAQKNKLFSFNDCKFANEKDKETTARIVMFKQFSIINSYTLESTFYAAFNSKNQYLMSQKRKPTDEDQQVKSQELVQVGSDFCQTIIAMIHSKILKRKFTVDTSLNHLYQLQTKLLKKQMTISSKDTQLLSNTFASNALGTSTVGNKERKEDKVIEEEFLQAQFAEVQAMKQQNEMQQVKLKRNKNINLLQGQIQQQFNQTATVNSGKNIGESLKPQSKIENESNEGGPNSEQTTQFQTKDETDQNQNSQYQNYLNGAPGSVSRNKAAIDQANQTKRQSLNKLSSTKHSLAQIDQSYVSNRTPLPNDSADSQNLLRLKKIKNKVENQNKVDGKPPTQNIAKKGGLAQNPKDPLNSAKAKQKEIGSPQKKKKESSDKIENQSTSQTRAKKGNKKLKKNENNEIPNLQPNSANQRERPIKTKNQMLLNQTALNQEHPFILKKEDISLVKGCTLNQPLQQFESGFQKHTSERISDDQQVQFKFFPLLQLAGTMPKNKQQISSKIFGIQRGKSVMKIQMIQTWITMKILSLLMLISTNILTVIESCITKSQLSFHKFT